MAATRNVPIQITVNLHESPKGEKPPKAVAYAFTSNGRFLKSAEIADGRATVQVPAAEAAQDVRIVLGPVVPEREVKFAELTRRGAQERFVRVSAQDKELNAHFEIPSDIWICWFRFCFVKGTLLKRIFSSGIAIDYPVCGADVQIWEVEPIFIILSKLSDVHLQKISEYMLNPQPLPPGTNLAPQARARFGLLEVAKPAAHLQQFSPASPEFDSLHNAALSGNLVQLRQALTTVNESALRFLLCWLFPLFVTKRLVATATTDRCGHFESFVIPGCFETPNFYLTASVNFLWFNIPIYEPTPISCYTYWNYQCGTEVTLYTASPFAPLCAPCSPVDAPENYVLIRALGNVQLNRIYGTSTLLTSTPANVGQAADLYGLGVDSPFGGLVLPRIEFDSSLRANNIAKYYRVRYRQGTSGDFTDLAGPISRKYNHFLNGGNLVTSVYPLGPTPVGVFPNLFEIPPAVPPEGDWVFPDPPHDLANAQFPTTELPSPTPGGTHGKYQLLVELFDSAGNAVDLAAAGIEFFVPTTEDPDGTIHTAKAATLGLVVGNAFIMTVHVDNRPTVGLLAAPDLDGTAVDDCGVFRYGPGLSGTVHIQYTASQPDNFAFYSYRLSRGVTLLTPPTVSGPVSATTNPALISRSVVSLLTLPYTTVCDVAGFAEDLYVTAMATDGWSRLSGYDSNPSPVGFALAPLKP
jgi:hypothetical protein